jgi:hypothetical protein
MEKLIVHFKGYIFIIRLFKKKNHQNHCKKNNHQNLRKQLHQTSNSKTFSLFLCWIFIGPPNLVRDQFLYQMLPIPPDHSFDRSNRSPSYQVQRQSPLNKLTICQNMFTLISKKKITKKKLWPTNSDWRLQKPLHHRMNCSRDIWISGSIN